MGLGSSSSVGLHRLAWQAPASVTAAPVVAVLVLVALVSAVAEQGLAAQELRLGKHEFDWSTVEQERAHFRWSAEVINETTLAFDVEVAIDLLDDDDGVLHTDTGSVTVVAGEFATVEHEGSMPFDGATRVMSFRFRLMASSRASR